MSRFTQEDLEWLDEHGFEKIQSNHSEDKYQFYQKDYCEITVWTLLNGFGCFVYLANDPKTYSSGLNPAPTMGEAIKRAVSELKDINDKRKFNVTAITHLTSQFLCEYEKGKAGSGVEEFVDSLSMDELRYIVKRFSEWGCDEGCPYVQHDFKCDFFNEPQFAEDADRESCPHDEWTNACWAKYFLEQYREEEK